MKKNSRQNASASRKRFSHHSGSDSNTKPDTSCWSKNQTCINVCAFTIFACLSMTVGILTVCLTSPHKIDKPCELTFKKSATRTFTDDSNPQHAAFGDFNQDTYQDIVIANTGTDNLGIFLGYRNGSFANQTIYSLESGSRPHSVAVGNFNNDVYTDIAVANYGTHSIGILFGDGNGYFGSQVTYSLGASQPLALAIGHLNDDNQLDIIVVNDATFTVSILVGYTNGLFRIDATYYMGYDSMPTSLAIADFNNDAQFDIAIVNRGTDDVTLLLANGNGTFESKKYLTGKGSHPISIAVGDLNNDGLTDMVIAYSDTNNIGIFLGIGNGTFCITMLYSKLYSFDPRFVRVIDFNNDTHLDIVVIESKNAQVDIFQGTGYGNFFLLSTYSTGQNSDPTSIVVTDFDGDYIPDMAVTNGGINSILVFTAYKVYTYTTQITYSTGSDSGPISVAMGDFNHDNYLDIVAGHSGDGNISVFINYGNGTFRNQEVYETFVYAGRQFVVVGDFNNDKHLDIVVAMDNRSEIVILLGDVNGTFTYGNIYSTGNNSSPISIATGFFNNDTYLDIIIANADDIHMSLFLGYGNGNFTEVIRFGTGDGSKPTCIDVGDFNNDSISDIAAANTGNGCITILLGNGNGSFRNFFTIFTGKDNPISIDTGDINNDGRMDIVYCSISSPIVGVILGYGNGTFGSIIKYSTSAGSYLWSVVLGDFTNDTYLDIVVANSADSNIAIFVALGNGSFALPITFSTGSGTFPSGLACGDVNNNKQSDIVVSNLNANNISVFLTFHGAVFTKQTSYTTGSSAHPYSVAMSDFNKDNQSDIVVANSGSDNIEIRYSYNQGTFAKKVIYSTGFNSRPQFVTVADFNQDNQQDIAVLNSANNAVNIFFGFGNGTFGKAITFSTGSQSAPRSIAVGDFNNDNRLDIVVANQGINTIGVFIAFDYVTFTISRVYIPALFPLTYFAVAGDFNNDHQCDVAVLDGNNDNLWIYLSYGNRTFAQPQAYSTGSSSASASIALADFNNDSYLDIVVTNSDADNIGVFIGYGNGSFQMQVTYFTGISSSPISVATGDFNKDNITDIVVANSGTNDIAIFFGYKNGTFSMEGLYSMPEESSPVWVTISDIDNNNIQDIVIANMNTNLISILFGESNGTFKDIVSYSAGTNNPGPCSVTAGDLNKDGQMDIAITNQGTNMVVVRLGQTNGTFSSSPKTYSFASSYMLRSIFIADINNDTNLDILVTSSIIDRGYIIILYGFGDGNFAKPAVYSTGTPALPLSIATADLDNDGLLDLVVANFYKGSLYFMFQYKRQLFITPWSFSTGEDSSPTSVAVGNFNNDRYQDIAVTNSEASNIGIFLGNGDGTFSTQEIYSTGDAAAPSSMVVGDFNNDNQSDIAVANTDADNICILFGYQNGSFSDGINYSTGTLSNPMAITCADLNKDNCLDIIVATHGSDAVLVFFGLGNGTFLEFKSYSIVYNSGPRSIIVGDVNNDNLLDIVVANDVANYVEILLQTC